MTIHLITGRAGEPHVTSVDAGKFNANVFGRGRYVLDGCECTVIDSNNLSIAEGVMLVDGRQVNIEGTGEPVVIENGQSGYNRIDLVCLRYQRNEGVETIDISTIKGQPTSGEPVAPAGSGSIIDGDALAYIPIYEVRLTGTSVEQPTMLLKSITAHLLDNIPMSIEHGGTGATDAAGARSNLGLGAIATKNSIDTSDISSGILPIERGGTGGYSRDTALASLGAFPNVAFLTALLSETQLSTAFNRLNFASGYFEGKAAEHFVFDNGTMRCIKRCLVLASGEITIQGGYAQNDVVQGGIWISDIEMQQVGMKVFASSPFAVFRLPNLLAYVEVGQSINVRARNATAARGAIGASYAANVNVWILD